MRVAVVFFGLARGMRQTIDSIRKNIYACNQRSGLTLYTVASLNLVETVTNPRTGECNVPIGPEQPYLLNADAYALVRQADEDIAVPLRAAQARTDDYHNEWISVRNALHQLLSLRRAWDLCANVLQMEFDAYLFVRPDLLYLEAIRLAQILATFTGYGNIALPRWHCYWGFNDRFAVADAAAARHYANRLSLVEEYCARLPFHPENLLAYALARANVRVCELPVRAKRVRAHGLPKDEDFSDFLIDMPREPRHFSESSGQINFLRDPGESPAGNSLALARVTQDHCERVSPLGGVPYLEYLQALHVKRRVRRYLEIGTQHGASLRLARGNAVAIDPELHLRIRLWSLRRRMRLRSRMHLRRRGQLHPRIRLYRSTSDAYFSAHDPRTILGGPIELAFIDGMHLSEYVLRDFINVERHCSPDSLIVLHDAVPQNFEMTERQRRTGARHDKSLAQAWTGDVWRILPLLQRERPDLHIEVLDCPPTGLVLVTNLDPGNRTLQGRLGELTRELTSSSPPESEFWSFIESLTLSSSRTTPLPGAPTSIPPAESAHR
jgi:predicted O-methyltransferase YrrM